MEQEGMMKKGMIINEDVWDMVDELESDEKAELLTALSAFYKGEDVPDLTRIVRIIFKRIAIDNARFDPENQQRISNIRSEAGRKGGSKRKQTEANESKQKQIETNESKKIKIAQDKIRKDKNRVDESREEESRGRVREGERFAPPTPNEVRIYANEHGLVLDADRFVDFYAANGWIFGGKTMKDWKAAARYWSSRDKPKQPEVDYNTILNELDRRREEDAAV